MSSDNLLEKEIKSLSLVFKITFAVVSITGSLGIILLHYSNQTKLARSYAFSTRNSIIVRDYRQALSSLAPAVDDGFSRVVVVNHKQEIVLQVASGENKKNYVEDLLITSINQNLSPENVENSKSASIIFYYSIFNPLLISLVISLTFFFVFMQIFKRSRYRLKERHNLIVQQKKLESASQVASQMAHDIRSPLSALNIVASTLRESDEEKRLLIASAVQRINEIANDLLQKGKKAPSGISEGRNVKPLSAVIEEIINEKKIQYSSRKGLRFVLDAQNSEDIQPSIPSQELSRILSNLINNSVEAYEENDGQITVALRRYPEKIGIIIQDDGKGIPEDVLSKLGERGLTYGKDEGDSGSGLGIWHAKSTIEAIGGDFRILSRVGVGTQVIINLPLSKG